MAGSALYWLGTKWQGASGDIQNAVRKIYTAITRDGMTPGQLQTTAEQLGDMGTIADVGGKNLKDLAGAVANSPGAGAQAAAKYLGERNEGQTQRLNDAVRTATGAQGSAFDTADELIAARKAAAAPAYDTAFDKTVVTPEQAAQLQPFIADPTGQQALQKGIAIARMESVAAGKPFNPADYGVTQDENGNVALAGGTPNLRLFDSVKRGYDQVLEQYRNTTTGKLALDQTGNAINNMRAAYVGQLRDQFPQYGAALDAWGGPSRDLDALNMGRRALTTDPDVTADTVGKLQPNEKQMFQVGLAQAMKDKIAATPDDADATRRIFGNQLIRNKIAAGFGDPDKFAAFQQTMNNEAAFANTYRETLKGSQTASRTAATQDMNTGPNLMEVAAHAALGGPAAAGANLVQQGLRSARTWATTPSAGMNTALGSFLFDPAAQAGCISSCRPARQRPSVVNFRARRARRRRSSPATRCCLRRRGSGRTRSPRRARSRGASGSH